MPQKYSFNGPDPSASKVSSSVQNKSETRIPQLSKIIYQSIKEKIRENHHDDENKISAEKTKASKSQNTLKGDNGFPKELFMWGEGVGGVLGGDLKTFTKDGKMMDALLPRLLNSSGVMDIQDISCGRNHAGVVTKNGEVFCWGEDNGGTLGHKIHIEVPTPKIVESLKSIHIDAIECAANHTCALTRSGELYAWGDSSHGIGCLESGTNRNQWIPYKFFCPLEGIRVTRIACGGWHTAIISCSGRLFTYGVGTFGVLGHGDDRNVIQPKEVESLKGLRVKSVACGLWHTTAIVEVIVGRVKGASVGGKLFTWGDNEKGRLGHGDEERRFLPTCVAALIDHDFIQVSCGAMLTVGLTVTGVVFTMGSSENGLLGNPLAEDKAITVVEGSLKDKNVKKIASGLFHVVALTMKGEVYTWGKGANGRLGLGNTNDCNSPALVEYLNDKQVETIACGSSFTAAICLHKTTYKRDQSICTGCKTLFSFTRRKHKCYICGFLYCSSCTRKRALNVALATNRNKQFRVCHICFTKLDKTTCNTSKIRNWKPRLHLLSPKRLSDQKTRNLETIFSQSHAFSLYLCTKEETLSLQRQASEVPRWGQVSCPLQFISCQQEYSKISFKLNKDVVTDLNSIYPQDILKFSETSNSTSMSSKPYKHTMLSEELQGLRSEVFS